MKKIGVILRSYFNKDGQEIYQINKKIINIFKYKKNILLIYINPKEHNLKTILNLCDGFVFPGGTYYFKREKIIYKHAIKYDKPILGICLGMQELCIFDTNKKISHIENNLHYQNANKYAHKISIKNDSLLYKIIKKENIKVNSVHHDYIAFKPKNLKISAYSEDGIIEALEYEDKKCILLLQWHPEYLKDKNSMKIINYFTKCL